MNSRLCRIVVFCLDGPAAFFEVIEGRSIKASLLIFQPILDIFGIAIEGDFVLHHCGIIILRGFGLVSAVESLACLHIRRRQNQDGNNSK